MYGLLPRAAALLVLASVIPSSFSYCFLPNGLLDIPDFAQCPGSTSCCALNRKNAPGGNETRDGFTRDDCLPNGLCQNRILLPDGKEGKSFWRNSCTDREWSTGRCLDVCTAGHEGGNSKLTPCDGTATSKKWCCGDKTDCCNTKDFVSIEDVFKPVELVSSTSISSSATATSFATSTTPQPSSSTGGASSTTGLPLASQSTAKAESSNGDSKSSDDLSTGSKIGIAIGVVLGALFFFTLGFIMAKYPQWQAERRAGKMAPQGMHEYAGAELRPRSYSPKGSMQ